VLAETGDDPWEIMDVSTGTADRKRSAKHLPINRCDVAFCCCHKRKMGIEKLWKAEINFANVQKILEMSKPWEKK
jgi:hypothetical protein